MSRVATQKQSFNSMLDLGKEIYDGNPSALTPYINGLARKVQYQQFVEFTTSNGHTAPWNELKDFFGLLPESFYSTDWVGRMKIDESIIINLKDDVVISSPWAKDRFVKAMAEIGHGCKSGYWNQDRNHVLLVLMPFRIAWFVNGFHSGMTGILKGEGIVESEEAYDVTPLYEYMHSDGVHFYETATGKKLSTVKYVEFAVIFELGRLFAS
jgi:hypothetical protein